MSAVQTSKTLFQSFFMGGFEGSTHRTREGRRLDMIAATAHDKHAVADYTRLQQHGIYTARDSIRWHLIERKPYSYDFSSVLPILHAARETGTEVIWDLCHYGWPDDIDVFKPEFVRRFAHFALAFAELLVYEADAVPFIAPINEISFLSWASGEVGYFHPLIHARGFELKAQLVRAAIEATEAIWDIHPRARIIHADPVINIIADPLRADEHAAAEGHRLAQYQAWDMLAGRMWPQLGGAEKYLDIIGLNYYPHNQWIHNSLPFNPSVAVSQSHPQYRPFSDILREVHERYNRPMFVAETGAESDARPDWLRYICGEVWVALEAGLEVEGVCLYPILNHPGWDDERHCHNGMWDYPDETGEREIYEPLARELQHQYHSVKRARRRRVAGSNAGAATERHKASPRMEIA